ncbi:MAG: type III pantothenate kinase [Verrucomicrobiota bacterium]
MPRRTRSAVLVIDIGNTSTSFGVYAGKRVLKSARLATRVRSRDAVARALAHLVGRTMLEGVVLSSVVPSVNAVWLRAVRTRWPRARVLRVNQRLKLGVRVTYPRPETIGADRLANACAAVSRYGAPAIVADFGTAVTFDVISRSKGYIGGVIAPGLPLMFSYLAEKTALLPRIGPGRAKHGVGKSTVEAMRLGAVWGYRGLVREIIGELTDNLGERNIKLCATGGYASWVLRGSGLRIPIDPDLTLYGLGRIYELNR